MGCWLLLLLSWALRWSDTAAYAQSVLVQGAGATLPMTLYLDALFSYRFVEPNVHITFDGSTTDQAFCRLTDSATECAPGDTVTPLQLDWGSAVSLPKADYYTRFSDLQLYPTVASAVVPIYNLNGVSDLVLTMQTLAKIWSGRITTWGHPDILDTNPDFKAWGVPPDQPIVLVARADSVGTTQVFKKALAGVDTYFGAVVGTASAPAWKGTQPVLQQGLQLVLSYVMCTNYSLSYSVLGDALVNRVPMARLNRSGVVVAASAASVQYAMLELGLAFGNNGDAPEHLTADLYNARNPLAWPIASYAYLAVRKTTPRPGVPCAVVAALVDFWRWFWVDAEVEALATSLGFSVLPPVVRDVVVGRFSADLRCAGRVVYQEEAKTVVAGYGPASAILLFDQLRRAYGLVNSSVVVNYTASDSADVDSVLQAGGFVLSTTPLPVADSVSLVLAGEALVAVSQYVLVLDLPTLAKILDGAIQTWLHADILALNPGGIADSSGRLLNNTAQRIVLLQGPTSVSAALSALLRRYYPTYSGAAIQTAAAFPDEVVLRSTVLGTPAALSVTSLVGQLPAELQVAALVPAGGGPVVSPTLDAIQACASAATYAAAANRLDLAASPNASCYPLSLTLYLNVRRLCQAGQAVPTDAAAATLAFAQWLYSESSGLTIDAAMMQLNVAPFQQVFDAVQAANEEGLFQLSCRTRPTPVVPTDVVPLLLAIIIPIAAVLALGGAGCGWWLWRVTAHNRLLRQRFSNDNVAESCAEAIARFDLQAVEWLREVKEPNKIQRAFLDIIGLLTDVKPFIPDQLLSQLMNPERYCSQQDEPLEETRVLRAPLSDMASPGSQRPRRERLDRSFSTEASSVLSSPRASPHSRPHPHPQSPGLRVGRHHPRKGTSSIVFQDLNSSVASRHAGKEWTRRRCAYMSVRCGTTDQDGESWLPEMARVVGRVVDIAKAHEATIESVGVDHVNVHWGVSLASNISPARAVNAGLEIAGLRDTLPADLQATFWLQIGVGKGICDCGTVSSESGHRFFVVWGVEPSLAVEIAAKELPQKVLAPILISAAVHQEVRYTVHCKPRLWHRDTLLWEPLYIHKPDENDEWMYELGRLDHQNEAGLLELFESAKDTTASLAALEAQVAALRAARSEALCPKDGASLDVLLATVRAATTAHL